MNPRISHLLLLFSLIICGPASAAVTLDGPLTQGGLVVGKVDPGSRVELDGRALRVSPEGVFVLGFHRDHPTQSRLRITHPDGAREERVLEIAQRSYDIQNIDGLPPRKVTPNEQDLKRIKEDNARIATARKRDDPRTDFLSGWSWPVQGAISGVYGSQRVLNGEPRTPHYGVDIAAPEGTIVRAPADGVVTMVHPDMFYSGGTLLVDHGHKLSSAFLHLHKILVKEGDVVRRGDPIAEVGKTGRVTGAHLDWRMNFYEARIDPQLLVPEMHAAQ